MNISPMDVFWIFLMLISLQPLLKQRMVEASRRKLIADMQHKRGSRVILLAHCQETMSFLGFPLVWYIDVNDSEAVIRAIHLTDPNASGTAPWQIPRFGCRQSGGDAVRRQVDT
jgi:ClpP class serine protease